MLTSWLISSLAKCSRWIWLVNWMWITISKTVYTIHMLLSTYNGIRHVCVNNEMQFWWLVSHELSRQKVSRNKIDKAWCTIDLPVCQCIRANNRFFSSLIILGHWTTWSIEDSPTNEKVRKPVQNALTAAIQQFQAIISQTKVTVHPWETQLLPISAAFNNRRNDVL